MLPLSDAKGALTRDLALGDCKIVYDTKAFAGHSARLSMNSFNSTRNR